jgi:hypothetical protein
VYCRCYQEEAEEEITQEQEIVFEYATRRFKEMLQRGAASNPQPKEPVFTPEDAIYAHSLGVFL